MDDLRVTWTRTNLSTKKLWTEEEIFRFERFQLKLSLILKNGSLSVPALTVSVPHPTSSYFPPSAFRNNSRLQTQFLEDYHHGNLPEYLVRSLKANPEHARGVSQFLEGYQRLVHIAAENPNVHFYFFRNTVDSTIVWPASLLQDTFLTEPDRVRNASRTDQGMPDIQDEPLNDCPPSDGLIDWSEWLDSSDLNWADEIPSSTVPQSPEGNHSATVGSIDYAMGANDEITIQESISQTMNDVSGIGEGFIPQSEPNQSPGCDNADLPALPANYPAPVKKGAPSKNLLRSKTGHSKRKRKAKRDRSSTQANDTHKGALKLKCSDDRKATPETSGTYQLAGPSRSDLRHSNYSHMWSLFGPNSDSALDEDHLMDIFTLATLVVRPELASFLESSCHLWQTGRFWNPDPLRLPTTMNLPTDKSCHSILQYLWDLKGEAQIKGDAQINVIRRRFAQVNFHLSFVRCQKEKEKNQCDRKNHKPSSHVLDDYMGLIDRDGGHPGCPPKKFRQFVINSNSWGKKWLLVSHYVGWGSLIVWNNIDTKMYE
uniref:Uncharacterized protein n=1 Tax=Talaromyces marneffei PM1 TaxID=1077442 RepID=A0A093UU59_TALMA